MSRHFALAVLLLSAATAFPADSVPLDRQGDPLPAGALARYGSARLRHPGGATFLAFSRDGRSLVSVGGEPNPCAIVWDAATGKAKGRIDLKGVAGAAFAADGTLFLAAAGPACVAWDPATGRTRPLASPKVGDEPRAGRSVAVSPDGGTIALGCDKGLIVWLSAAEGRELGRLERRGQPSIDELIFSPDGQSVGVRAANSDFFLADAIRFRAARSFRPGDRDRTPSISAFAFRRDGTRLAVSTNEYFEGRQVHLLEADSDESLALYDTQREIVNALHFTQQGGILRALTIEGNLINWNAGDGKLLSKEHVSTSISAATFSADGTRFAAADQFGFIRLHEAAKGKVLLPERAGRPLASAAFVRGDEKTVMTHSPGSGLNLWERDTGSRKRGFDVSGSLALSPDGQRLAVWDDEHTAIRLLDAESGKELFQLPFSDHGSRVAFSPDGRLLAVTRPETPAVEIWAADTGRLQLTLHPGTKQSGLHGVLPSWSPDSRYVMVIDREQNNDMTMRHRFNSGNQEIILESGSLWAWETASGSLTWTKRLSWQRDRPVVAAWLASGRRLALMQDRVVATYRVAREDPLSESLAPADSTAVGASPDGRWLAIGTKSGAIHVWEPDGRLRRIATGHGGAVTNLTFSADSSRLLSSSEDGTALLWDVSALPPPAPPLPPADQKLERDWALLAAAKGPEAPAALDGLAAHPAQTVPFLAEQLKPVSAPDAAHLARLALDLGNAKFEVREQAQRELAALGEQAEPTLRESARNPANPEARKRIASLLAALDGPIADPELLRQVRSVELLEQMATPLARNLLALLARGDPAARLTKEAAAALRRLRRE